MRIVPLRSAILMADEGTKQKQGNQKMDLQLVVALGKGVEAPDHICSDSLSVSLVAFPAGFRHADQQGCKRAYRKNHGDDKALHFPFPSGS